jgi:hypothetical protein
MRTVLQLLLSRLRCQQAKKGTNKMAIAQQSYSFLVNVMHKYATDTYTHHTHTHKHTHTHYSHTYAHTGCC